MILGEQGQRNLRLDFRRPATQIWTTLTNFCHLVRTYDDRALVLALAAFAEDTLGRLLVTYLREGKPAKELVEGFNAPLGTLSSRIKACFAIGLLTREQYEDLEVTRKIRNSIAHSWVDITLDRQDMRALVGQLNAHTFDQKPIEGGPRDRLLAAISNILIELRVQIAQHRKHSRRAPFVGFRLYAGKPFTSRERSSRGGEI
jgi:hypothetical protein